MSGSGGSNMGRPWFACEYDGCEAEGWRRVEEQMVDERGRKLPQRIRYWLCQAHHPQGRSAPAMPARRPERSPVALAVERAIQSRPVPAAPVLEAMRPSVVVVPPAQAAQPRPERKPRNQATRKRQPADRRIYEVDPDVPPGTCRIRGCGLGAKWRGACESCAKWARAHGRDDLLVARMAVLRKHLVLRADPAPRQCKVEGCDRPYKALGLCTTHFRHKDLRNPAPVPGADVKAGIIRLVGEQRGIRPVEIRRKLGLNKHTVHSAIERLWQRGAIVRDCRGGYRLPGAPPVEPGIPARILAVVGLAGGEAHIGTVARALDLEPDDLRNAVKGLRKARGKHGKRALQLARSRSDEWLRLPESPG